MNRKVDRWRTRGVRSIRSEITASEDAELHCVLARSGQKGLDVNLDISPVEVPELVRWIDDLHK